MNSELKYDISVCVDTRDLAWEAYEPAGWPGGLRAQVLRRLESDSSIRAAVITQNQMLVEGLCQSNCLF